MHSELREVCMSRIANAPIDLPAGVEVSLAADLIKIKGAKGELELALALGFVLLSIVISCLIMNARCNVC